MPPRGPKIVSDSDSDSDRIQGSDPKKLKKSDAIPNDDIDMVLGNESTSPQPDPFLAQMTLPPSLSHTAYLNHSDFIFHTTLSSLQQEDLVTIYRKFPMFKTERDLITDYALQAAKLTCAVDNNRTKLESYLADYEADIIPSRFKTKVSGVMDKFKAEEIIATTNRELFKAEMERIFITTVTQCRKFAELYLNLFTMIAKINKQQIIRMSNLEDVDLDHPITPNATIDEDYIKKVLASYCDLNPRTCLFLDSFNNHMAFFSAKRFKHQELAKVKAEKKLAKKEAFQEAKVNSANTLFANSNAVSVEDKINLLATEIKSLSLKNSGRGRPATSSSTKTKGKKLANSGNGNTTKKQKNPVKQKEGLKRSSSKKANGKGKGNPKV